MRMTLRAGLAILLLAPLLGGATPAHAWMPGYTIDLWAAADVVPFGNAPNFGSSGDYGLGDFNTWPAAPLVGMAATPAGDGYWEVGADGGVYTYHQNGNTAFFGSMGGTHLNQPVVGMTSSATGKGYWLVAADGGIFAFGDAGFLGSTGGMRLNQPIVGMARTPTGKGYWLVAADGGIFTFGDAHFHGSTGAIHLNRPIVGMAATPTGNGYWLVAADGGIFSFGDAIFHGSTGAIHLNQPIVGMAATPTGNGYWLVAADGGVFTFGDAAFLGSLANHHTDQRFVGMAATPDGGGYWLVGSGFCYPPLTSTAPVTVSGSTAPPVAQLQQVAIGVDGCREQATHTFRMQSLFLYQAPSPAVVSFDVRYVSTPTPGPSGQPVQIAGNAFLEVTLHGTTAGGAPGFVTPPPGSPIVAAQQTEDFEGVVRWVIGLDKVRPFSAGQVSDPFQHTNNLVVEVG
jgi:hypothetical protein